ncbi:HORMA domain-containing protein [Colletotrichum orchidophilum]|uniref:HORMA domain-containing protein n=1 Tax=Colletotrichum orchidophilum TaxID=1209926 RepID=A0A1G4BJJ6_9PEZI|nr:HORMA domain-containing protein [Colletotrichum orchidophilum]OHF01515.1 HORMA domain-containing protein [Colletotrichum orchidophilum]
MGSDAKPARATKATKADKSDKEDKSKVHKLALKGSAKLVAEFFQYSIHTILFQRGVYPAEDFSAVKKYGLNMLGSTRLPPIPIPPSHPPPPCSLPLSSSSPSKVPRQLTNALPPPPVSSDDQVRAYIKKIMSQLDRWMLRGKISKLVIVITDKDTGEHVERWQFDVEIFGRPAKSKSSKTSKSSSSSSSSSKPTDQENAASPAEDAAAAAPEKTEQEIQSEIAAIFRQITASVTFLPQLDGDCTFNVLVYADADSEVPVEWGDSDAKEIVNGERVQLRGFSTSNHRVDTLVSYRLAD